jgi:hypothetical protein
VRQAITRAPSSSLMSVLFWLILFGLVAVLIQTSRRTYTWHVPTIDSVLSRLVPAEAPAQERLAVEEV